jgi:hypothetical protein
MKWSDKRVAAAAVSALFTWPALAAAQAPKPQTARLTHEPIVMRLSKDEFRIAFGIGVQGCAAHGCSGVIHYRVAWRTEDGAQVSEIRRVSYTVPANYGRAMTVDRQYFDTAEGAHTTELTKVTVSRITCEDGTAAALATRL